MSYDINSDERTDAEMSHVVTLPWYVLHQVQRKFYRRMMRSIGKCMSYGMYLNISEHIPVVEILSSIFDIWVSFKSLFQILGETLLPEGLPCVIDGTIQDYDILSKWKYRGGRRMRRILLHLTLDDKIDFSESGSIFLVVLRGAEDAERHPPAINGIAIPHPRLGASGPGERH